MKKTGDDKILKRGECNKQIAAFVDPGCFSTIELIETQLPAALKDKGFKVFVEPHSVRNTITWKRISHQTVGLFESSEARRQFVPVNHACLLMAGADLVRHVNASSLYSEIESVKSRLPDVKLQLLVCGLKKHCKANRGCVSVLKTETSLAEVLLMLDVSHRLLETPEELISVIVQISKAIAEEPLKRKEREKQIRNNLFLGGESRDCVGVENELGLTRLFQQMLTRIPGVTLEVAESIISEYPVLPRLMEALEAAHEPEKLLENLPIRKPGIPGTSKRRIGPELSKRIANVYLLTDPKALI